MRFGDYIRAKGFTARSLSEAAGVNVRSLENYTTGRLPLKNMTLTFAGKLAKALKFHAEDLLQFDD